MVVARETVTPTAAATPSSRASLTIGTNIGTSSAGNVSKPARAALRQPNRCCGDMSCRRATSDTTAPGAYDSATIRPLVATLQRRRRPTPTRISTRPRGSEASSIWSTICANRYAKVGSHLAAQIARYKVGAEFPLTEQEAGLSTSDVCRKHGISSATFYKWKAKFGGLDVSDAKRLKSLEDENAKLKKLLAEAMLDNAMLKDIAAKKW